MLVPALAEALWAHRASRHEASGRVFKNGVPTAETLHDDLKACDIAVCDDLGRVVSFHALRHTFGSMLARAGIPSRVTMELMRHSDMRLTQSTSTDATLHPLFNEVEKLPSPTTSRGASPNSAKTGQNERNPVQSDPTHTSEKIVAISERGTHLGKAVPSWENAGLAERVGLTRCARGCAPRLRRAPIPPRWHCRQYRLRRSAMNLRFMAERVGFEPTVDLRPLLISSQVR